jgi:hypothetical protein
MTFHKIALWWLVRENSHHENSMKTEGHAASREIG